MLIGLMCFLIGLILFNLVNNLEYFSIGVPTDFVIDIPPGVHTVNTILIEDKFRITQYYDLYKIFYAISRKYVDHGIIDFILHDKKTKLLLLNKGFIIEDIYNIEVDITKDMYEPLLCIIIDIHTGDKLHLLNLYPNTPQLTIKYYQTSINLLDKLMKFLKFPIDKLIIVGHSSGAALNIVFINHLFNTIPDIDINSYMCITTGLGKCDSFVVNEFEKNVIEHNIEYYDIINMYGDPKNEDCWMEYYIDNRLLSNTMISHLCFSEFCNNLVNINLSNINDLENILIELNIKLESLKLNEHNLPPNYLGYYEILISQITDNVNKCLDNKTIYNCMELFNLFHKHISINTYAILPSRYQIGDLVSYNKNELLNAILLEGDWTITENLFTTIINNNDINMCFSGSTIIDLIGAHTLKSYHTNFNPDIFLED